MHQNRYCIIQLFGRWGTFRTKKKSLMRDGVIVSLSLSLSLTHTHTHTHELNKHETQITALIVGLDYKESVMF